MTRKQESPGGPKTADAGAAADINNIKSTHHVGLSKLVGGLQAAGTTTASADVLANEENTRQDSLQCCRHAPCCFNRDEKGAKKLNSG